MGIFGIGGVGVGMVGGGGIGVGIVGEGGICGRFVQVDLATHLLLAFHQSFVWQQAWALLTSWEGTPNVSKGFPLHGHLSFFFQS